MQLKMRVGLIGLGAIGRGVLRLLGDDDEMEIVGALVADPTRSREPGAPPICGSLDHLLEKRPEVIVELAGHAALRCYGPPILGAGIDLIVVSIGALADPQVEQAIVEAARAGGSRVIVASGAIGALDAIASAAVCGGLSRVTHTTRKPARALLEPAEAAKLTGPLELFRGSAREGALRFPENINVAAAVSLAGIGLDRTEVCVIADPNVDRNSHEVVAQGEFGDLRFEIRNIPTDDNPRTGRLVAMSIVHALRRRHAPLVVG
jgi:aspartate dehydrogenase